MFESAETQRRIGRFAWVMAWVGLVVGQLHALARHNTADGREDLHSALTRAWSDPARAALRPLLEWGDPDLVYVTYGKIWLPVFVAFTLCAFVVRRRRRPAGFEKWAWRVALTGYVWACVSVLGDYWTQWTGTPNALLDLSFLVGLPGLLLTLVGSTLLGIALGTGTPNALLDLSFLVGLPGLLLTLVGSTLLGIALVRNGLRPRSAAWLLTLTIPVAVVALQVTSMGSAALAVMFGFGILGRRIAAESTPVVVARTAAA